MTGKGNAAVIRSSKFFLFVLLNSILGIRELLVHDRFMPMKSKHTNDELTNDCLFGLDYCIVT